MDKNFESRISNEDAGEQAKPDGRCKKKRKKWKEHPSSTGPEGKKDQIKSDFKFTLKAKPTMKAIGSGVFAPKAE